MKRLLLDTNGRLSTQGEAILSLYCEDDSFIFSYELAQHHPDILFQCVIDPETNELSMKGVEILKMTTDWTSTAHGLAQHHPDTLIELTTKDLIPTDMGKVIFNIQSLGGHPVAYTLFCFNTTQFSELFLNSDLNEISRLG